MVLVKKSKVGGFTYLIPRVIIKLQRLGECDEKIDPGLMNRREIQEIDQISQLNFWQGCKHNREILVFRWLVIKQLKSICKNSIQNFHLIQN